MKTKILSIILMIAFVSCGQKSKSQQTENQNVAVVDSVEKQGTINENLLIGQSKLYVSFRDTIDIITIETANRTIIDTLKYTIRHERKDTAFYAFLNYKNEKQKFIIRQTQTTEYTMEDMYYHWSEIKIEIYDSLNIKKLRSFTKNIDEIKFNLNYIMSIINGCCGMDNKGEFSDIWQNNTYFKFSYKYYTIKIPNNSTNLYLGFLFLYDFNTLNYGELYLAHENLTENSDFLTYKLVNKVALKVKDQKLWNELSPYQYLKLDTISDKDTIFEKENDYNINVILNSYKDLQNTKNLNFSSFKLILSENENVEDDITIEIPIQNGYLFGDKSKEQIIYLDDYIKN